MKQIKNKTQIVIRKADENEYYFVYKLPSGGIFMSNFFENLEETLSAVEKIKKRAEGEFRTDWGTGIVYAQRKDVKITKITAKIIF